MANAELFAPACSIALTKRRRFFWAAWWTAPPRRAPFQPPDAADGGAESFDEALRAAEAIAGTSLTVIESAWARAFMRTLRGQPPWATVLPSERSPSASSANAPSEVSVWERLQVSADASAGEIRAAFRSRAKQLHPDHGGDQAEFRALMRAYDEAIRRAARPRRKRPTGSSA